MRMEREGEKIRVLHLLWSFGVGGIENQVSLMAPILHGMGIESLFLSLTTDRSMADIRGIQEVVTLSKKEGNDPRIFFNVLRAMKKKRPHVVHLYNWSTFLEGLVPAMLLRCQVVYSFFGRNADEIGRKLLLRKTTQRFLSRFLARITVPCRALQEELAKDLSMDPSRISVVEQGVDLERFETTPEARENIRRSFGFREDEFVIGTVARMDPVKDLKTLIRGFFLTAKRTPEMRLLLVGDGPVRPELERMVKEAGFSEKVLFAGKRTDLPSPYFAMDAYCQVSLYEGMSNSIMEAMAAGLPVVATHVGGNRDLVTEGETGFLLPCRSPFLLSDALERICRNKEQGKAMGKKAREEAQRRFSLNRAAMKWKEIYTSLVPTGPRTTPSPFS